MPRRPSINGETRTRASGETPANEEARAAADAMTEPEEPVRPAEPEWRTPKFMRMRFNWGDPDERNIITSAHEVIERTMLEQFHDAYRVLATVQDIVRTPVVDTTTGEVQRDPKGNKLWVMTDLGYPVEDYSRLTRQQIEDLLGLIVTRLFAWEQQSARMWGDSMFAKARFEERFAIAYTESLGDTVDDRKSSGNSDAAEERYHAIFLTSLSRRAEALVKSMDRIHLRLRDIVQGR